MHPPADCIGFYSSPENRGYLADPRLVAEERLKLSHKYGYELKAIADEYLKEAKDPKQTFFGLEPGWIVDLKDKVIIKPTKNSELYKFYSSSAPTTDNEPKKTEKTEEEEKLVYPPFYPHYLPPGNTY